MSNPDPIEVEDAIGLSGSQTVGLIVGVAIGGTILVLLVLLFTAALIFWCHRRDRPHNVQRSSDATSPARRQASRNGVVSLEMVQSQRPDSYHVNEEPVTSDTFQSNTENRSSVASPAAATEARTEPNEIASHEPTTNEGAGDSSCPPPLGTDATDSPWPAPVTIVLQQFPREDLVLQEKLGEGEYGPIYRGEAFGLGPNKRSKAVTVKMLSPKDAEVNRPVFNMDIEMLSTIGHVNVIGLLAVCTKDSPECILLDAGLPGDLLTYMRDQKDTVPQNIATEPESKELLRIADEISLGMAYLASERFIHKDLALRNCIIDYNGVIKISHFGLGPLAYPEAYYRVNETDLPIRWMSPEAITSANFTTRSDVWSYGVALWELFTYGDLPYEDLTDEEVLDCILEGKEGLGKPMKCSNDIFSVMKNCWDQDPHSRIGFLEIHEKINEFAVLHSPISGATPISPLSPMTPTGPDTSYFPSTFRAANS